MNCREFAEQLHGWLDEAATPLPVELTAHAATCRDCGTVLSTAQRMLDLAAHASPISPPPGFAERVVQRWQRERAARHVRLPRWAIAASLLLAAGLALYLWHARQVDGDALAGRPPVVPPPTSHPSLPAPQALVTRQLAQASDATLGLTRRAAAETFEPIVLFIPRMPAASPDTPATVAPNLSLEEWGRAMNGALDPVTDSAASFRPEDSKRFDPVSPAGSIPTPKFPQRPLPP